MSPAFTNSLFVVSANEQARFLLSLPQVASTEDISWVAANKAAAAGLPGTVQVVAPDFAKPTRLRTAVVDSAAIIRESKASVVLAGSGPLALPFFLAARKNAIKSIFLESPNTTGGRSALGVAKLADTTIVEWEHQLVRHPFATVLGETV